MQLQVHILPTKFAFCRVFLPLPFRSTRHSLCRFSAPNPGAAPSGWGLDDRLFIKKARTIKLLKRLQRLTKADQSFNQPQNHKKNQSFNQPISFPNFFGSMKMDLLFTSWKNLPKKLPVSVEKLREKALMKPSNGAPGSDPQMFSSTPHCNDVGVS